MDRSAAKNLLMSRSDGTFLVRQKDGGEFAISIKFNMDIRHIKITSTEGLYRINEKKAFKGLIEMIQFYQQNSLKEYFKDVDTTLRTPYKQPEQSNSSNDTPNSTPGGSMRSFGVARARYDFSARDRSELSLRGGRHHQDPIQERSQWLVERRGVWPGGALSSQLCGGGLL
ncbi:proto-oncogene vav [Lates calcarifer]|uniref:Proto-oncogene vav n=1 Tax=Lates calcarifer TaxID=8187 RepID=A0AAJ7VCA4_LATCA|nr:proto-oncogene vav [Lates calcarifer]